MTLTHDIGAQQLRPAQEPCPHCPCCTAPLCERGRTSLAQCHGHVDAAMVAGVSACPCSAETTRGTHAWRQAQYRVVKHATQHPLSPTAEHVLRSLAGGDYFEDPGDELVGLRARRYADGESEGLWRITPLGRRYLRALEEPRYTSAVHVNSVDARTRTAKVVVLGWHMEREVTVLAWPLVQATDLELADLPGRYLEAKANVYAVDPDDLVLTRIQMPAPITEDYGVVRPLWAAKGGAR